MLLTEPDLQLQNQSATYPTVALVVECVPMAY